MGGLCIIIDRALAFASFVDKGLSLFTIKFKSETEGKAFGAIVGMCFALALVFFSGSTMLWAQEH